MGNLFSCFSQQPLKKKHKRRKPSSTNRVQSSSQSQQTAPSYSSNRWTRSTRSGSTRMDDQQQAALAAATWFKQVINHQNGAAAPSLFDRSASLRYPNSGSKKTASSANHLSRSSSSRARSLTDPLLKPQQLVNQVRQLDVNGSFVGRFGNGSTNTPVLQYVNLDGLETTHFVLVHGGGFGAWCWYKTIALLEEGGFKVTAVDLTGSGVNSFDTNSVTSLSEYAKPLTDFLGNLGDGEKVILVGHDFGGACISYAMEMFHFKISKAIFVAAAMLTNGHSILDMFSEQADSNDLMRQAQIFLYANGNDHPPTAIDLDKSLLRGLLFNETPSKDVALASVSMRPIPFAPVLQKLSLSDTKYGSVRRFYIETPDDNAIPITLQEKMINASPPERVLRLKGSDHSPFFSKPQALHKLLLEISKIPLI